jgi:hypothetical protein
MIFKEGNALTARIWFFNEQYIRIPKVVSITDITIDDFIIGKIEHDVRDPHSSYC